MEEQDKPSKIKVNDKRRFTTEGEDKHDLDQKTDIPDNTARQEAKEKTQTKEKTETKIETKVKKETRNQKNTAESEDETVVDIEQHDPGAEINFLSFITSLATQALIQLGAMPMPEGVDLPISRAAAKQTIDLLGMLKEKTAGNLDAQELKMLEEILHTLRISFFQSQS